MTRLAPPDQSELAAALRGVGLRPGDVLLVHSDVSPLMPLLDAEWWEDALEFLLQGFQEALTPDGTLLVPTFNYDFCRGHAYDSDQTPSQVGLFTNYVRRRPGALRSLHPIFSFAGLGPRVSELFAGLSRSAFGAGSVFARLYAADARLVFFNTTIESSTFVHFVEQQLNVDYRFPKYFTGPVRAGGQAYIDTFEFFVRYQGRGIQTRLTPLGERLEQRGLMQRGALRDLPLLAVRCRDLAAVARAMWLADPYALLAQPPGPLPAGEAQRLPATRPAGPLASPKALVAQLHPLHRTLVSDGTDDALALIGEQLPAEMEYYLENYPPTKRVWTWRVPERFKVDEAYLETETGERLIDFRDNPLHLVSYSLAVDRVLTWDELRPHLYFSERRPGAIPWVFKYYERDWGFCLSRDQFERLPHDQRYHAVIRTRFEAAPDHGLRVGVAVVGPTENRADDEVLLCAHICHPGQSNDDATGVAVCVEVLRRLAARPLPSGARSVRCLFGPETIGTICYLAHHEDLWPRLAGGLFIEMAGNRNSLALQRTRQDQHVLDRIAVAVLSRRAQPFRQGAFRDIIRNDEMVINGPGVNVPCLSLSRWPYEEYHTSDDRPELVDEAMLIDTADAAEAIIRIFATNYVPQRTFQGPIFLSGYGLHVDQRVNRELNRALEQIMLRLEGRDSIFDIAEAVKLDYDLVWEFVEQLRAKGLVQPVTPALTDRAPGA